MPYQYKVETKKGYLLFTVSGVIDSVDDLLAFSQSVMGHIRGSECNRILLDERETIKRLDQHDFMVYADRLISENSRTWTRVAAVYSSEDAEKLSWAETFLKNRSISYKIFSEMNEAEKWLLA